MFQTNVSPFGPRALMLLFGMLALLPAQVGRAKTEVAANAPKVRIVSALNSELLLAGTPQRAYLKVSLTGFELEASDRAPVNVALVLDKSGSMSGEKIARAREAAIEALYRLRSNDIFSIVTYDTTVNVLVPATKVADREEIERAIRGIQANGSTALFAGVSKGAAEVRKFFDKQRYNHIILLSDGLANVGPSSPAELAALGASLYEEGIGVSTLGLGLDYNEDLMTQLARASDGNHYFAEEADDLARVFDRAFGGATAVVAQDVQVEIRCAQGVRPLRVLGREATIDGQNVIVSMNQIYSEHEKYILLEVEIPGHEQGKNHLVATVQVDYLNLRSKQKDQLNLQQFAGFSASRAEVEKSENAEVMIAVVEQIGAENNRRAMELNDQGRMEEARKVLLDNADYYGENARRLNAPILEQYGAKQKDDAQNLAPEKYARQRKSMIESQTQQQLQNF